MCEQNEKKKKLHIGAIVTAILSAIALISTLAAMVAIVYKRFRKINEKDDGDHGELFQGESMEDGIIDDHFTENEEDLPRECTPEPTETPNGEFKLEIPALELTDEEVAGF